MRRIAPALVLLAALSGPAIAQTQPEAVSRAAFEATTLNLSAHGETQVAPDRALISLGVQTQATTAQEAMRLNHTFPKWHAV